MADDDYFRGDQKAGITAPDLTKPCKFHEHIVRARGRRTAYTSVSLDRNTIERFGDCDYILLREKLAADEHGLVKHGDLIRELEKVSKESDKSDRIVALQAIRYARMRKEGIVCWVFRIDGIDRKDIISWAGKKVQQYFKRC